MAVKDKSGDIAVLRTLGAKDGLIGAIFVWYGLLAGSVMKQRFVQLNLVSKSLVSKNVFTTVSHLWVVHV
jgi:hypothetical protein